MARWLSGLTGLVLCCGATWAIEVKGPVVKVEVEKNQITLTIDGKDQTFDIRKGAKVYTPGRKQMEVTNRLSDVKVGAEVTANAE